MFQIKSFLDVSASMVNRMRATTQRINDYNVGAVARTMLEAPAQEVEELYQQMVNGLVEAIPTAVYTSFDFSLLPPVASSGLVRVTITSQAAPVRIAAGTIFTPVGGQMTYAAQADATIIASNTFADIGVAAITAGAAGNLPAGTTFTLGSPPAGFLTATNLSRFVNGSDQESPDQRKQRFQSYIVTLARGTLPAIDYGLRQAAVLDAQGNVIERVALTRLIEPYVTDPTQPVGLVLAYVHNGTGSTSANLVQAAATSIYGFYDANGEPVAGYKAAGVHTPVAAATEQTVTVSGTLTLATGTDPVATKAAAQVIVGSYITALGIGVPYRPAAVTEAIMEIPGVTDCTGAIPATNVVPVLSTKLMPGSLAGIVTA